jgi:adenylate cyclase
MKPRWQRRLRPLAGAAVAWLLALGLSLADGRWFGLEASSLDLRFQLRGPRSVEHSPLLLVEVDNRSYKDLNERFPFPRGYHARAIRNLLRAGVACILLDIQFTEEVAGDEAGLAQLAEALVQAREAGVPVLLSGELVLDRRDYRRLDPPLPALLASGQPWGLVNDLSDLDGVNRLYPLYLPAPGDGAPLPTLGASYLGLMAGVADSALFGELRGGRLPLAGRELRLEPGWANAVRINYYGPAGSFPVYSFSDILDDADFDLADPEFDSDYMELWYEDGLFDAETRALLSEGRPHPFRGRTALIGVSAMDLHDNKRTPFFQYAGQRRLTPGVEVHAHAIQTLLDERWIVNPLAGNAALGLLAAMALAGAWTATWLGPLRGLFLLLPLAGAWLLGSQMLFASGDLWLEWIGPLGALAIAWTGGTLQQFLEARRERAQIRGMFARYVPEAVVAELIKDPGKLVLGGEEREMSALFSDVAGFTTISEGLSPTQLVELLNEYLTAMTDIIVAEGGIIDKYEGDAIIAEFGAPLPCDDHADRALRAAVRMQRQLAEMRPGWAREGRPELRARVGVNSGRMVVGNMGSRQIFDYTAMGDAMNLASRLEGVNKVYGSSILCSGETWRMAGSGFVGRRLDRVRVKGKTEAVELWEVLAEAGNQDARTRVEAWNEALALYEARDWAAAAGAFAALEAGEGEGPAAVLARRCRQRVADPPPADWDGIETLTEK